MSERTVTAALTSEEWTLIADLRDIPEGPTRRRLLALLGEVIGFTARPGCAEMQADGVPCSSAHTSCDDCQLIAACLAQLRRLVGARETGVPA